MQDTLIDQGFSLMLYGMGTVFIFLTILVFATWLMSTLVNKFAPEQAPTEQKKANLPTAVSTGNINAPSPQVLDAIKQAISAHRQR